MQLFRVRTVTCFLSGPTQGTLEQDEWRASVTDIVSKLNDLKSRIQQIDVEVQTVRLTTSLLDGLVTKHGTIDNQVVDAAIGLEKVALECGLQFLNLGTIPGNVFRDFQPGCLSDLVSRLGNTSLSVSWDFSFGFPEALRLSKEILAMEKKCPGCTFRFGVLYHCGSGIPYYPASHSGRCIGEDGMSFAIGTENSHLLQECYEKAQRRYESEGVGSVCPLALYREEIIERFSSALKPVEDVCLAFASEEPWMYGGIDTSIAPDLQGPNHNMEKALTMFSSTGTNNTHRSWSSGTSAMVECVTKSIKSLNLSKTCGYCGVMLPLLENDSLSNASSRGDLDIQKLLLYSNLCGVGIDTVPVTGYSADEVENMKTEHQLAALLLDMAAISNRQKKSLSVRVLPVTDGVPGSDTAFSSPYLIDGKVMDF